MMNAIGYLYRKIIFDNVMCNKFFQDRQMLQNYIRQKLSKVKDGFVYNITIKLKNEKYTRKKNYR